MILTSVFPQLISNYHLDCPSSDTKLVCQFQSVSTLFSQLAQMGDLFSSEFRMGIAFPKECVTISAFICHIFHVIRLSSFKQMFGIYTGRIIAGMTSLISLINMAAKFLCQDKTMNVIIPLFNSDCSVSSRCFSTFPNNTIIHNSIISQRSQDYNRALTSGERQNNYLSTKWRYT